MKRKRGGSGEEGSEEGRREKRSGVGFGSGDGRGLVESALSSAGVVASRDVRDALLTYFELLLHWGQTINLTAARSVAVLATEHLPDALAIASRLALRPGESEEVIDVGSGGGLPAIPLALLRPQGRFTLVEATGKKTAFLRAAARELGLADRLVVEHRRLESGPATPRFDVALSRAMLAPEQWVALGAQLVRVGGSVFSLGSEVLGHLPAGMELVHQASYRAHRWLAELKRST